MSRWDRREGKHFSDIAFGKADGDEERAEAPNLLLHGFLDDENYVSQLLDGSKFLVLGPKGAGKSALGAKLELTWNDDKAVFVRKYEHLRAKRRAPPPQARNRLADARLRTPRERDFKDSASAILTN